MSRENEEKTITSNFEIFSALNDLTPNFKYLLIGVGIIFVSTRLLKAGTSHIFALLAVYLIIQKLSEKETLENVSFNEDMEYRLKILGSPSQFYRDANLINLFYNIYGWRSLNPNNFDHALKAINNILQIESDSEKPLKRCVDNYDVAHDQRNLALNLVHGFIYSLDNPILVTKLKKVLKRLQILLERHIVNIQKNCQMLEDKKSSIDVHSRFIEDANGPKPYDGGSMSNFDYY